MVTRGIVIAGTGSGVGKTSITLGILAALSRKGLKVQPFKVGPDFIDPLHHEEACGRKSVNLDGWMLDEQKITDSFCKHMVGMDFAVVEGVMGLFDGRDGKTDDGSTAQIAKWLNLPVVLVLDCWSIARSAAAVVKGFREFDPGVSLKAIVFNKVGGEAHTEWLREAVSSGGGNISVLGGIPKVQGVTIPERHLGLHLPGEASIATEYIDALADLVEQNLDLDALLAIAGKVVSDQSTDCAPKFQTLLEGQSENATANPKVRIAVATGAAFCFYYEENMTMLRQSGAEFVFFDPLVDDLPQSISGVYFGGGYPELHAAKLSSNLSLRFAVKEFANAGGVVYAECGGLMYLSKSIQPDLEDEAGYEMVGVFPFRTVMTPGKMHMGYVEVTTNEGCALFPANQTARGHVYHFSEIVQEQVVGGDLNGRCAKKGWQSGYSALMQTPGAEPVSEGYSWNNVLASYVHLHFGSAPEFSANLVRNCQKVDLAAVNARSRLPPMKSVRSFASVRSLPVMAYEHVSDFAHTQRRRCSDDLQFHPYEDRCEVRYLTPWSAESTNGTVSSGSNTTSYAQRCGSPALSVSSGTATSILHEAEKPDTLSSVGLDSFREVFLSRVESSPACCSLHSSPAKGSRGDIGTREVSCFATAPNGYNCFSKSGRDVTEETCSSATARLECSQHSNSIVSFAPSATEILFALGLGQRVIAVTDHCDYPSAATCLPKASSSLVNSQTMTSKEIETVMQQLKQEGRPAFTVNGELLKHQRPGLVFTQGSCKMCDPDSNDVARAVRNVSNASSYPIETVQLAPRTFADVLDDILRVGKTAGAYQQALQLVDQIAMRLHIVARAVARDPSRPKVLSLEGLKPLVMGGGWIPEMKRLAGGIDDLQEPGDPATRVTWEQVCEYAPEVLVLAPCSLNPTQALPDTCDLAGLPRWWALPAVRSGRVFIVEHSLFSRPGPRLIQGVEVLARILHPDIVTRPCPENTVLKLALCGGQRCRPRLLANYFLPYM